MRKFVNSFEFNEHKYYYYDLQKVFDLYPSLKRLPNSLKILLEANIRNAKVEDIDFIINTFVKRNNLNDIEFHTTRVILDEQTALNILVDLATIKEKNENINPLIPLDVLVSSFSSNSLNIEAKEKLHFLKYSSKSFKNLFIVPSNNINILKQVNLEYLATIITAKNIEDKIFLFPEALKGTYNYGVKTNALGILGLSTDVIEAQNLILAKEAILKLPKVLGLKLVGSLAQGVSILDICLSLFELLKNQENNSKIIEFFGLGIKNLSIEDRSSLCTIAKNTNALSAYFCLDDSTIDFVEKTRGVDASLIKTYFQKQKLYNINEELNYDEVITFDLSLIKPSIQDLKKQDYFFVDQLQSRIISNKVGNFIKDNDIVFASISSYCFLSNPSLLVQLGLLAKKACQLGLKINDNIKRCFILEENIIKVYLEKFGFLQYFESLGFSMESKQKHTYELVQRVSLDIEKFNLSAVCLNTISNEKFFANSLTKQNFQTSPALILAFCIKGNINFNITKHPLQADVYLSDIWPSMVEVNEYLQKLDYKIFAKHYQDVFLGDSFWQGLDTDSLNTYSWNKNNSYIMKNTYLQSKTIEDIKINDAKILAIFEDETPSEYICAKGQILPYSSAANYLENKGLRPDEFASFDKRRANNELIYKGTLSNIKLRNKIVLPKEGGYTKDFLTGELLPISEFTNRMKKDNRKLIIFAGNNFGFGNFKAWASKGLKLFDIKAVIANSFDEEFRFNLLSLGILPLEFIDDDIKNLALKGSEIISINAEEIKSKDKLEVRMQDNDQIKTVVVLSRLDNKREIEYYKSNAVYTF